MDTPRFIELNQLAPAFQIGGFSGHVLGWGFIPPTPWRNYLHSHSFFEICYAFAGHGVFRVLGTDYAARAGDVFVAHPGVPHEIIAADGDPLGLYHWSHTLTPRPDAGRGDARSTALLRAFLGSPERVIAPAPELQRILDLLTAEIVRREAGYGEAIEALIVALVLQTARAVVGVPGPPAPAASLARSVQEALVQTMTGYLQDNYSQPIALRDVAAQVHLSDRHANRLFHASTGQPIMRYLARLRLDIAAQLLLERQLPIKDVAQRCGYPDVRHFITRFRERTDVTPARFRLTRGTVFLPRAER